MANFEQFNSIDTSTEGQIKVESARLEENLRTLDSNLDEVEADPSLKDKLVEKLLHPLNLPALGGLLYTLAEIPQEDLEKACTGLAIGVSTTVVLRLLNFLDKRSGNNSFS